LWSIARYDLGLSDSEFWELTPAQFDALNARLFQKIQREDFRAGQICSTLCNLKRQKKSASVWQAHQFFPSLPPPEVKEMTPEEMLGMFKQRFG